MALKVLRAGYKGEEVLRWQYFLVGEGLGIEVTGVFDTETFEATRAFQRWHKLKDDGEVGKFTYGRAQLEGFDPTEDDYQGEDGPNWPLQTLPTTSLNDRLKLFGYLPFTPKPIVGNPENVVIPYSWTKEHIVTVKVPQIKTVSINKIIQTQFVGLWQAWEDAGLNSLVKTFDGAWAPRFVRGSRTTLSSHSWGTAFDINARWNGIGKQPPFVGKEGSVRKLVPIAEKFGFGWGGFFPNRPDGMHFEVSKILP